MPVRGKQGRLLGGSHQATQCMETTLRRRNKSRANAERCSSGAPRLGRPSTRACTWWYMSEMKAAASAESSTHRSAWCVCARACVFDGCLLRAPLLLFTLDERDGSIQCNLKPQRGLHSRRDPSRSIQTRGKFEGKIWPLCRPYRCCGHQHLSRSAEVHTFPPQRAAGCNSTHTRREWATALDSLRATESPSCRHPSPFPPACPNVCSCLAGPEPFPLKHHLNVEAEEQRVLAPVRGPVPHPPHQLRQRVPGPPRRGAQLRSAGIWVLGGHG